MKRAAPGGPLRSFRAFINAVRLKAEGRGKLRGTKIISGVARGAHSLDRDDGAGSDLAEAHACRPAAAGGARNAGSSRARASTWRALKPGAKADPR